MQLISFYWFTDLTDCEEWRENLSSRIINDFPEVRGTILLAPEGVNAALCGPKEELDGVVKIFSKDSRFTAMPVKRFQIKDSHTQSSQKLPFNRLKIKCRQEIVNFRIDESLTDIAPATDLNATEWNQLIADPDTLVLDARNNFEYDMGSFPDAINPQVERFSHLAAYIKDNKEKLRNKKVAIYCTGGIRCEKLGKYMKKNGIEDVYQLQGGILQYFQEQKDKDNLWEGECFVFDERISVNKQDT